MRITTLSVKNLRLFGDEEQKIVFNNDKNVTVLLGDNGAGKTSLLYASTVLLSQFYEHFPECPKKQFVIEDVRNISNERRANYLHVSMELTPSSPDKTEYMEFDLTKGKEAVEVDMYLKGNDTKNTPSSQLKAIKDYSLKIKTRIDDGLDVALPIIAYYGTERGQIKPVERRRNFKDVFSRWDIYKADSLDSATDFRRFFTWFERNEDLERREQKKQKNFDYTSPVLNAVRRALNKLFEGYLENPRVEASPLRFVMDDVSERENPIEKRLERMSDGYRITIALVADIASRMAESNPTEECSGLNDPLNANGIVLIDEIDLHLHPKLQREILRKLTTIFPNVQFIVSTHSPNVVIGALDLVQIIKLDNGKINRDINTDKYKNDDISLLLLSDLFSLDNVRTPDYLTLSNEYEKLLSTPVLNNEQRKRIDELGEMLDLFTSLDVDMLKNTLSKIQGCHD